MFRLLPVLVATVLIGCGTACKCHRQAADVVSTAPERVEIDGREYSLAASLWRDFQPIAPPNGQPMAAVLKVSPSDMMPLPTDLVIDHLWVLNGKKQWSAAAEPPAGQSSVSNLDQTVRGGPKWETGILVDVVVRLRQGKQTWLLRQAGVKVKRTD